LYYKCVVAFALALTRVVNYPTRLMLQIVASLINDPRGVICNCKMFIVKAPIAEKKNVSVWPVQLVSY